MATAFITVLSQHHTKIIITKPKMEKPNSGRMVGEHLYNFVGIE
jgi:hypothetical protein